MIDGMPDWVDSDKLTSEVRSALSLWLGMCTWQRSQRPTEGWFPAENATHGGWFSIRVPDLTLEWL
jgi:hypothetical protein